MAWLACLVAVVLLAQPINTTFSDNKSVRASVSSASSRHTPVSRMIISSDRILANTALKAVLAVNPLMAVDAGYAVGPAGLVAYRSPLGLAIQFGDAEMVETVLATQTVDLSVRDWAHPVDPHIPQAHRTSVFSRARSGVTAHPCAVDSLFPHSPASAPTHMS